MAQAVCPSLQRAHSAAPALAPGRTRTRLDSARTELSLRSARASPWGAGGKSASYCPDAGVHQRGRIHGSAGDYLREESLAGALSTVPRPSTRLAATPPKTSSEEAAPEGSPPGTPLSKDTTVGPTAETSPLVRLAWYASEAFGKAVAVFREKEAGENASQAVLDRPLGREEAAEMLRKDYDQSYFVTGAMTMDLYERDCEFADPFVSFRGRDRFKQNVSNLGSFMEDISLKILDWDESEDKVTTRWRFSCVLGLPWRPILAASGGTDHFFDRETGRIFKHVERWDISPADGVRQLLKPNPKLKQRSKG